MDEQERRFENCVQAHGDLVPSSQAAALGQEQMQAYVAPPQGPPVNTCSNFARGSPRLFSECMDHQRSYSEQYCSEATNKQEAQYIQCMAGRGFRVSGLPETYEANVAPSPPMVSPLGPQGSTLFTPELKKKMEDKAVEAAAICAFAKHGETYLSCAAHHWRNAMGVEVAKMIACHYSNELPVNQELKQAIVELVCS